MTRVIGVTDPMSGEPDYLRYTEWIRRGIPDAEIVRLSFRDNAPERFARCHALVLTGGGDVHPGLYSRQDALADARGVIEARDGFELRTIDEALALRKPVLAICRGAQIFNVSQGGSLIPDIEAAGYPAHKQEGARDRIHPVRVESHSLLHQVIGSTEGEVTSSHHQAVDRVGNGLRVSARSPDGIVEGLEWESPRAKSFLIIVQWHPERMPDPESPFSGNILLALRDAMPTDRSSRPGVPRGSTPRRP